MIKTVQQTWSVTYYDDPTPGICITRKEGKAPLHKHDFTLAAAKELVQDLQECIDEAESE